MATTMQLQDLIAASRQRADFVNSQFVTDSELTSYINQSYFELYDLLVSKYGDDYYVKSPPQTITTDGVNYLFALASDFYKLLGVDLALNPNTTDSFVTIKPFNFAERNRYSVPNFQSFYGVTNMRYRLSGNNLWLTPTPAANQVMRVWYVPRMTQLVASTDTVDGISGWTEYIIIDCCIKMLAKEESDPTIFVQQKMDIIKRIEAMAENRDAANPPRVADSRNDDLFYPNFGSGSGTY